MKHRPTLAAEGRFWSQNDNGYWELYKLDKEYSKASDKEYRYVTNFTGGKAMVAERDCPVTVINTDGKVLATLDSVGGKPVDFFSNINDGLAVFNVDTLQGVTDYSGRQIVPAKYFFIGMPKCERILAFDHFGEVFFADSGPESENASGEKVSSTVSVYDYSGNKVFNINSSKYHRVATEFTGGYLPVGIVQGEDIYWGLVNTEGELVLKPNSAVRYIQEVRGNNFIYVDSEGNTGVKALDGTTVLKPRNGDVRFLNDELLAVSTYSESDVDGPQWNIVDLSGSKMTPKKYWDVSPVFGKYLFVQTDNTQWTVLEAASGEIPDDAPKYTSVYFSFAEPNDVLKSDHINLTELIEGVRMTPFSVGNVTFQSSVESVLKAQARYFSYSNQPQPENYSSTDEVSIFPTIAGELICETITFPTTLSHQTYREEEVIDGYYGWFYSYHIDRIPTGFAFTSEKPAKFQVLFNNYGKLRGKLRPLFNDLVKHFSQFGSVEDNNGSATVINLGDGHQAIVALEPNSVKVLWGNLSFSDTMLSPYAGNSEELKSSFAEDDEAEEPE
ncbi:MAG: hypothetical protein NC338_03935 [Firmicutes bacterium]|nr:hypothetical protein [Bacillota bacterium]MCM1400884.1 hypothetical protein [Bacteroides sp.]MCM1476282.1 hypothetical protein [Bacteroides sp.]